MGTNRVQHPPVSAVIGVARDFYMGRGSQVNRKTPFEPTGAGPLPRDALWHERLRRSFLDGRQVPEFHRHDDVFGDQGTPTVYESSPIPATGWRRK
jgi:hypothetical protein